MLPRMHSSRHTGLCRHFAGIVRFTPGYTVSALIPPRTTSWLKAAERPPVRLFDAEEAEDFEDAALLHEVATPENELMSKQVVEVVNSSLQELPDDLRTALTLREIEGLSYEEIAAVMDCPIGTVRSRIFRAREAIATNLRPLLGTNENTRW